MRRYAILLIAAMTVLAAIAFPRHLVSRINAAADFAHYESAQVHPLAITPDGTKLLVCNTPDARLTVFDITGVAPVRLGEVPVGLEPVSVCAHDNGEAWVVNQLSDDVSIVDLATLHVKNTLKVGDEPADVVFAGTPERAWVSVMQEDAIKLYDPTNLAAAPQVIAVPARSPRSLSVGPNKRWVYAAVFSGSHGASVLPEAIAGDSLAPFNPPVAAGLPAPPKVSMVINRASGIWRDVNFKNWNAKVPYTVPLAEMFQYDANTRVQTRVNGDIATIMMGTDVNPVTNKPAITGMYQLIELRYEPIVRGHISESRVAFFDSTGFRTLIGLNPQINYSVVPGTQAERDSAIGNPTGVTWSADGHRLYVTSLATDRIAVVSDAGALLARVPTLPGPTGVIADPTRNRLYVLARFHDQLQTLSTANFATLAVTRVGFDPTPDDIVNGRRFFYGGFTSGHGDQACANCHLFGDMDQLAWDLGDPQGAMAPAPPGMIDPLLSGYHPMKGPMVTQSLRGLANTGLLHWRGDRADLTAFNGAFVSLMGRAVQLPDSEMAAFSAFVMPLQYPPNPNQMLDRSFHDAPLGQPSAVRGRNFYLNSPVDGGRRCVDCHAMPTGTNGQVIDKFALIEANDMKIPHLRNMYRKSGFSSAPGAVNKRGFGYTHNGTLDNLFDFLLFPRFDFGTNVTNANNTRRDLEAFLLSFDTGTAPVVGAQVTFDGSANDAAKIARLDTLRTRADAGDCDLIAKGRVGSTPRGWKYNGGGQWISDLASEAAITSAQLRALAAAGHEMTMTGVPPGTGTRAGIDRDRDGYRDADELAAGSDPGDPASTPVTAVGDGPGVRVGLRAVSPNPMHGSAAIDFALSRDGVVDLNVYDVLGRHVRQLARHQQMAAGAQRLPWDGRREDGGVAGAGVYFVRLHTTDGTWSRMIVRVP